MAEGDGKAKGRYYFKHPEETKDAVMVRGLDELATYEELTTGLLGTLKQDLRQGLTSEQILKKYAALAAARVVSVASTEVDSAKAMAAAKDILDRSQGKAVERHINVHAMSELKDEELDALLLSKLKEVGPRTEGDSE
jgi:hypothetical protein